MRPILFALPLVLAGCSGMGQARPPLKAAPAPARGVPVVIAPPSLSENARNNRLRAAETPQMGLNTKVEGGGAR